MSYTDQPYEGTEVIYLSTRPPLTPLETEETEALVQAIKDSETFHLDGYLPSSFFENLKTPALIYTAKESEGPSACTK